MSAHAQSLPLIPLRLASQRREPPSSAPSPRKKRAQAWLALHLRDWSLHAALNKFSPERRASLDAQAVAVLDEDRQRRVLACNAQALRRGVRPGHALNAAMALCADIRLLPRDTHHEAHLLERLANWAQQYTPAVSLELPNELLLEVRGSLRLFDGAAALVEKVHAALRAQHIDAGTALSATARSALWLARGGGGHCIAPPAKLKSLLAVLPVSCLHWTLEMEMRLARFGVQTVGDLLRLPRADLARRIGADCARELDCALGRQREIRALHHPPQRYEDHVTLDFEVETVPLLEAILIRRLDFLQRHLQARDLALSKLRIELLHREQKNTPLHIGLAAPTADMGHVARLLGEHLARIILPQPVSELRLRVHRLLAAEARSIHLFQKGEGDKLGREEGMHRLLERLRARLGEDAVMSLQLRADHRPEKTQVLVKVSQIASSMPLPRLPPRPLWLLQEPLRLGAGLRPRAMHLLRGPERIETGWWDGEPIARDYYVAQDAQGALCWIYREQAVLLPSSRRKPGSIKDKDGDEAWYLHGWFG